MKRGGLALLVSFVGFMIFGLMGSEKGDNADTYQNLMVIFGLLFGATVIYMAFKLVALLKRKAVEQVKKGVSATSYGKKNELRDLIRSRVFNADIQALQTEVANFAQEKGMDDAAITLAVKNAVPLVIEDALSDGILTDDEQASIDAFLNAYSLSTSDISERGQELLVRGALIRDLLEGNIKPRMDTSAIPYKMQKNEIPIWAYSGMTVAEVRNVSRFEGGSQGVSFRVAKGVYWRVGKTAAQRVTSEEIKDLGSGTVLITSHHLYYHVGNKAKRIKHDKIFNISQYSDAVVVHMDGANAKPLVLKTDDTWFLANVLQNSKNWS